MFVSSRSAGYWQVLRLVVLLTAVVVPVGRASALIFGGTGNSPLAKQEWPTGAAVIFDHPSRVAWWEGPPFGGGQYHAECRGDAEAFNEVLADFAKLDVATKRLIVHNGVGHSFWLNKNREPEKEAAARIDWVFMVWNPANWERLQKMPAELRPTDARDAEDGPPSQIDVYTGGNIRWADVVVPDGIELIDERLEAHGYTLADGVVLEGTVTDLLTQLPIAAQVRLQKIEPQPKGGYRYPVEAETTADAKGHWVLKHVPTGRYRVVTKSRGYVPRVVGHLRVDDQPRWHSFDGGLATTATVSGDVTDDMGEPLADVDVSLRDVVAHPDQRYESPDDYSTKTDSKGHFVIEKAPVGQGTIRIRKPGYCRPGLGQPVSVPSEGIALQMQKAAELVVTVDFGPLERPAKYLVHIEPEGGSTVGSWGGSGHIDANNQMTFRDAPPGRYTIIGHPNPTTEKQKTVPVTIELIGGKRHEVTLNAQ